MCLMKLSFRYVFINYVCKLDSCNLLDDPVDSIPKPRGLGIIVIL